MVDELRRLASELRTKAASAEAAKKVKVAQLLQAAVGLQHFSKLLGH